MKGRIYVRNAAKKLGSGFNKILENGGKKMKAGLDVGYNETKLVVTLNGKGKGRTEFRFPSIVGTPEQGRFGISETPDSSVLMVDGQTYLVGEEVIIQSQFVQQDEDRDWYLEPAYRVLVANGLSLATDATSATFDVCTGLPLSFYGDRDKLRAAIGGEYLIKRGDRPEQRITINFQMGAEPRVVGQPFGTLLSEALDDSGQLANPDLAEKVAVLDVGGHTTNILACQGLVEVAKNSRSIDKGGWDLVRTMGAFLDKRCPGLDVLPHEIAKAIVDRRIRYGPEWIDLTEYILDMAAPLAGEVITRATQYLGSGDNYSAILITGGGAHLLGEAIKAKESYSHAVVVANPNMANAIGYWKLLMRSTV